MRMMSQEIRRIQNLREDELYVAAKDLQVPVGIGPIRPRTWKITSCQLQLRTCCDLQMLRDDAITGQRASFVGSGIFKSGDPVKRASAIVKA